MFSLFVLIILKDVWFVRMEAESVLGGAFFFRFIFSIIMIVCRISSRWASHFFSLFSFFIFRGSLFQCIWVASESFYSARGKMYDAADGVCFGLVTTDYSMPAAKTAER